MKRGSLGSTGKVSAAAEVVSRWCQCENAGKFTSSGVTQWVQVTVDCQSGGVWLTFVLLDYYVLVCLQVVTSGADYLLERRSTTISLGESLSGSYDELVFSDTTRHDRHLSNF